MAEAGPPERARPLNGDPASRCADSALVGDGALRSGLLRRLLLGGRGGLVGLLDGDDLVEAHDGFPLWECRSAAARYGIWRVLRVLRVLRVFYGRVRGLLVTDRAGLRSRSGLLRALLGGRGRLGGLLDPGDRAEPPTG